MASFSDIIKDKVKAIPVDKRLAAVKSSQNTFKKGTPEYSQYKADIAQYEVESQSFFNTQRDVAARSAEFKRSELDSQKEYSATIKDRYNAFVDTAYLGSDVAKAVNRFAIENVYSNGTEDNAFVSTNNVGTITKELARSGIAPSEYAYTLLQGAKNQSDYDFYLQTLRSDEKMKESSAYLTPFRAGIASVEGAVLTDPTMLAYAPAALFTRLQGGMRIASVIGSNAALQGSLSMMRTYGSPERTTTDLALDIAFGGIVDSYFTMKQLGRLDKLPTGNIADDAIDINDFAKLHEDSVMINKGMDNFGNKAYDLSRSDLTGYKWSNGIDEATSIDMMVSKQTRDSLISIYKPSPLTRSKGALDYITKLDSMLSEAGFSKEGATYSKGGNEYTLRLNKITRALDKSNIPNDANIALDKNLFNAIEIEEIKRVKGIDGTSMSDDIIKQITKFADDNNIPLVLRRASNKGMDDKLKRLYERHGFTDDMKGIDIKPTDEIPMVRMPNESKLKYKGIVAKNIASASKSYAQRTKNIDKVIDSKKSKEKASKTTKTKTKKTKSKATTTKEEPEYSQEVETLETEKAVFHRIASVVDEIVDEAKVAIDDLVQDGLPTQLDKDTFAKELSDDLTDVLGQEVKVEIKDGITVKGKLTFKVDSGNVNIGGNAIKVGTLMAIGGGTALMADDGSSVSMISPPFIIIALAGGIFGFRALRNASGVKEVIRSAWNKVDSADKIARIMEKPMFKSWEAFRQTSVDKANFEIINSMQVVMNNGSELSRKIGQRLGFDSVNPQEVLNAMESKGIMARNWVQAFTEPEEKNFREWLKENNYNESLWDEILEGGAETKYREMFLEQVTDYNEFGKYANSKTVVAQANIMKSVIDEAKNTGMINKIIGFSEKAIAKIENYIPRVANKNFIMSVVHYGGKDKLSEQFVKAIRKSLEAEGKTIDEIGNVLDKEGKVVSKKTIKKLADNMIEWYSDVGGKYAKKSKAEAVIRAMKRLGYDTSEIDADLLIAESKTNSDAISRGKFRIGMDFSEFEPFKVYINGVDELVTLGTVFERNANSLVKIYADQVAGAVSLRRSTRGIIDGMEDGVTSESALRELIDKEINDNVRDVLHTYVDVVAGKPLSESTGTATRIIDALRDLAYARLALTQFAMASEYATALTNMMRSKPAMEQGLTHLRNIVRRATGGESVNTAYAATAQRLTGMGSSSIRRENTLKNIDNVFNQASKTDGNTAEKVATMVKYLTLRLTNILHADDAMKTISVIANTDYLSKWLKGDITISKNRLERFGINDKFTNMFKGGFKSDENGNLLADWDSGWTQDMKDEYARVMNKMVRVDSPEAIASALPHVALTSDAGRLTSFMTHFTATSYSTKFLQGAKRPDVKSYADTMIYFLGTYAGVYARHLATKQEEPDAEEVLHKAIMMMPLTAPYGVYSMVTDPMTTSMPNDMILEMSKLQDIIE